LERTESLLTVSMPNNVEALVTFNESAEICCVIKRSSFIVVFPSTVRVPYIEDGPVTFRVSIVALEMLAVLSVEEPLTTRVSKLLVPATTPVEFLVTTCSAFAIFGVLRIKFFASSRRI
jgi:hypothetical protein